MRLTLCHPALRWVGPLAAALALLAAPGAQAAGPTGRLNDTGQTMCHTGGLQAPCTLSNSDAVSDYPRQDGRFGRDVAGKAKTGGGAAGFDFSCVLWNGTVVNSPTCYASLAPNTSAARASNAASDWACTKDNQTNLIWSMQTVGAPVAPDTIGGISWNDSASTASGSPIASHNASARCGFSSGWRLPTRRELLSIVHHGAINPAIDSNYFPQTRGDRSSHYWTSDLAIYANPPAAWLIQFYWGTAPSEQLDRATYNPPVGRRTNFLRLVRSGP